MTEYKTLTAEDIARFEEKAHELRAQTIRAGFTSMARGVTAAVRFVINRIAAPRHA
ncbi:MAG: hypothetical protein AAGK98_03230 [Pseudomonadota bacterium]